MTTARVLIVEDDPQLLDVLSIALGEAGYETKAARDGLEGMDAAGSFHPQLIVADVNMPRLDGFATTSGFGHWFPFRMMCPTEAPIIELARPLASHHAVGARARLRWR